MRKKLKTSPPMDAPRPSKRYTLPTSRDGDLLFSADSFETRVKVKPKIIHIKDRDTKEEMNIGAIPIILPVEIFNIGFILRIKTMCKGRSNDVRTCIYERSFSLCFNLSTSLPKRALPIDIQKSQLASIIPRESSFP